MKIVDILRNRVQIYDYLENELFQTRLFRESVKEARKHTGPVEFDDIFGKLWAIIHEFANYPRFVAEMTSEDEYSHFSPWWNVISKREYDNPYVNDLYYLHDMFHMVERNRSVDTGYGAPSFYEFFKRTSTNELRASIMTEVVIYFMHPEIRDKTFGFEIWADRFLNDGHTKRAWNDQTHWNFMNRLEITRKNSMVRPDPTDWCELQIYGYVQNNIEWAKIWKGNFMEVENHMLSFYNDCGSAYMDLDGYTIDYVIERHLDWLDKHSVGLFNVPFEPEARDFNAFYRATHKEYGNHILEHK